MFYGNRKQRRRAMAARNTAAGGARGRMKWVSYCPFCPIANLAHPENHPHATGYHVRVGSCPAGHRWETR